MTAEEGPGGARDTGAGAKTGSETGAAPSARRRRFTRRAALGIGGAGAAAAVIAPTLRSRAAEAAHPPIGRFVDADGVRLHVVDEGPADDPAPVVLIHGASGNVRDFTFAFSARLAARGRRVLAVDRPGFGYSERGPRAEPGPGAQARMMRAAVARLGVGGGGGAARAVIVGHSLGAAPALAWALDAPESVRGVLSLAGVSHPWPGGVDAIYHWARAPVAGRLVSAAVGALYSGEATKTAVAGIFAPQAPPPGYMDYVGVGLALRPSTFRHNAEDIAGLKARVAEQARRYATLAVPVEVVHGAADRIVYAEIHAAGMARDAPEARVSVLDGVGHMPHHAAPEAVLAAI
ncbi:MAG: alpha/beta fold hydrolase, partial [Pseudomonadota bacterium]